MEGSLLRLHIIKKKLFFYIINSLTFILLLSIFLVNFNFSIITTGNFNFKKFKIQKT